MQLRFVFVFLSFCLEFYDFETLLDIFYNVYDVKSNSLSSLYHFSKLRGLLVFLFFGILYFFKDVFDISYNLYDIEP